MSTATQPHFEQLASFAAHTSYDNLPLPVVDRAKWVLRDTVGVTLGGMADSEVVKLIRYAIQHHPGDSPLIGIGGKVRPEWAALIYGTAGTTLEYDEGHAFARGHAAVHAVGTVLALAASDDVSGRDLLTAMVVGYEVAARVGIAAKLREGVHPFGAWGVVGAATVGAKLAGFSEEDMLGVMNLAASYAITPSFKTAFAGANVRNTYAGFVNHNGLLAGDLYRLGFRGEVNGIQTAFGEILGDSFALDVLVDELGQRYEMMRGYFKPYAACRYAHAAIDALLAIRDRVRVEAITHITVETYDIAAKLINPNPSTPLAARFSIPYIVAATLCDGNANEASFTAEAIRREPVLKLAGVVDVVESNRYTAMLPEKRAAGVRLQVGSETIASESIGSKGDPDQPMSEQALRDKFWSLTRQLTENCRQPLWDVLGDVEKLSAAKVIFAC